MSQITTISKFVYSHQPCLTRQQRHQTSSTLGFPDYSPPQIQPPTRLSTENTALGFSGDIAASSVCENAAPGEWRYLLFLQLPHLSPSPLPSPPFLLFQLTSAAVPEGGQGCVVRPKKRLSDFEPPSYVLLKCHSCLSGHEPEFTKASFSLCLIHSFPTLRLSGRLTDQD